ncbi:MAG: alcohol dehydrogenase catalytic domain-containing protein [Acidobacteriota bacterium]
MKALFVDSSQRSARIIERDIPEPPEGEALIRVSLAGICGTDLEILAGYMDYSGILGHEFVGTVESSPSDPSWEGKRVVGELNCTNDDCGTCRREGPRHCPNRDVLGILGRDGTMAQYVLLPIANLHPVPDGLDDRRAVFAEPLAAALEILEQVHLEPTTEVLLLGDGRLAQLIGQVLLLPGCRLTVCGKHEDKLAMLAKRGARTVRYPDLPEGKWDVVVEATGRAEAAALAVSRCRPRGTIVLKSTVAESGGIPIVPVIVDELRVVGSRCGPFSPALSLLERGRIDVDPLVSEVIPLDRATDALTRAGERGVLKVLLEC